MDDTTGLILDLRDRMARIETKLDGHQDQHATLDKRMDTFEASLAAIDVRVTTNATYIAATKTRLATLATAGAGVIAVATFVADHLWRFLSGQAL